MQRNDSIVKFEACTVFDLLARFPRLKSEYSTDTDSGGFVYMLRGGEFEKVVDHFSTLKEAIEYKNKLTKCQNDPSAEPLGAPYD